MVEIDDPLFRNNADESGFGFFGFFGFQQPETVGDPVHMGINRHDRLAEGIAQHDVCSFPADAGQALQRRSGWGHRSRILLHQFFADRQDILCLVIAIID